MANNGLFPNPTIADPKFLASYGVYESFVLTAYLNVNNDCSTVMLQTAIKTRKYRCMFQK